MVSDQSKLYCIDSSAFIILNRYYDLPVLWNNLDDLFKASHIISHSFVFEEINPKTSKPDFLAKWISDKKSSFFGITERQTQLVSKILSDFPGLIDHNKEINEADPWLIALAIERKESFGLLDNQSEVIVVSEESRRSSNRIPAVCKKFGIPHMSLKEFFQDNGWKLTIEST